MSRGYQRSDAQFVDYELQELPGVHGVFRGPAVGSGDYVACLGASQTFGRYVAAMKEILEAIDVPKILFWFSERTPDYEEKLELPIWRLYGGFPQLVNRSMVESLRSHCDAYVECVSRRGLPHLLFEHNRERSTDSKEAEPPVAINRYYPSPEMHEDAAARLLPVCRDLLGLSAD